MKQVCPSVQETAFNCPYCGAFAQQSWFSLHADWLSGKKLLPDIVSPECRAEINFEHIEDVKERKKFTQLVSIMAEGLPFLAKSWNTKYMYLDLYNTFVSKCFNCQAISIWIRDKLVYPRRGEVPPANPDLSKDIRQDYDEASRILDLSPRGAAALLRLAIQKLCIELKQPGKNLNDDIGALVATGRLDSCAREAIDAVRVIGNNAVHPGQMDLRDNRPIAESLFRLLNLIAEKMISGPKHVKEVFATLPESARKAIEERDANN